MPQQNDTGLIFFSLGACILVGHWLKVKKPRFVQEAGITILIGAILAVLDRTRQLFIFNDQIFFELLLPPIIFTAGYCNHHKHFFRNLTVILLFGFVGTLINFALIAYLLRYITHLCDVLLHDIEILSLASILSATDSVAVLGVMSAKDYPNLYGVLAGEGIINDAIALVLFGAVSSTVKLKVKSEERALGALPQLNASTAFDLLTIFVYVFIASIIVGILFGGLSAVFFKFLASKRIKMDPKREIAFLVIIAYCANYFATLFEVSGILALFVCGVMMSHYTVYSLSEEARIPSKNTFETLSFFCETFLFVSLGYYAVNYPEATWCVEFLLGTVIILMVARGVTVAVLTTGLRLVGIDVGWKQSVLLWWAGMIRGALAFALSFDVVSKKSRSLMISTTYGVVMVTTFIFGGTSCGVLEWLEIPIDEAEGSTEEFWASHHWSIATWFRGFDERYAKRIFGGKDRRTLLDCHRSAPVPETVPLLSLPHRG